MSLTENQQTPALNPQDGQKPPPTQEKKIVNESTFGISAILSIALVAVFYAAITGETPGLKQGIWLGPIALILVAPIIEMAIKRSKAQKRK
jgi:hypothetical protein